MRLDNFVYTEESFREARSLLAPNGIIFIKFQINHFFMGQRLAEMLSRTFGKPPVVFFAPSSYSTDATCFVISPSSQVETTLAPDPPFLPLLAPPPLPFLPPPSSSASAPLP